MDRPTPADVLPRSELLEARFPDTTPPDTDPPGDENDPRLLILVEDANVWVEQTTGRVPLETAVPDALERIALQAVTLKTEEFAERRRRQIARAQATGSLIRSFTAGSYSETRVDPGFEWSHALLSANPDLQEALWLLCTEERQDEIRALALGKQVPASEVQSFDWDRSRRVKPPRIY